MKSLTAGLCVSLALSAAADAQDAAATYVLIENVRIFDGVHRELAEGGVLIENNLIKEVGEIGSPPAEAIRIDGGGRTLMPGLTDAHTHLMMSDVPMRTGLTSDLGYLSHVAAKSAEDTLLRGFTTVRDMGGPTRGLKRAIDEGLIRGPRIYPSLAMISQTSGHGDFRSPLEIPAETDALTPHERMGFVHLADGAPECRKRAREVLMLGATQIKFMAGGGVSSDFDPLDVRQFSLAEMRAIVDAADAWNTYATVHAYTPQAMRMAIEAGVKCIEHGHLMDEATAELMAERGVWLSLQPFLDDEDAIPLPPNSPNRAKQLMVVQGTELAYRLARKHQLKIAFGTDTLFSADLARRQNAQLVKLGRWFEPWEVLRMATSANGELFKLCGPRDPYPGKLGVVAPGALADLILVDGDPLRNLPLIADPERNFLLIMKDGKVYKNTLP